MWGHHPSCSSEARPDRQPLWTALGGQRPEALPPCRPGNTLQLHQL